MESGTQEESGGRPGDGAAPIRLQPSASKRTRRRPTSVALTDGEIVALKAEAKRRNVRPSALMREAIRQYVGQQHCAARPASIGIADGVVGPDIVDDVVELANQVVAVGYAAAALETRLTRRRRAHVRLLLQQTVAKLNRIAGAAAC